MLNVDLSIRDFDGQAIVALRGELSLADTPGVASHLIAAVAACGPSVIVDLAGLDGIGYSGLSVLLRVRKWAWRSGGDLPLAACLGAECADLNELRGTPALGGARPEGQPRPVPTDQVVSRQADMVVAVTVA